jgi:hypothetical protein
MVNLLTLKVKDFAGLIRTYRDLAKPVEGWDKKFKSNYGRSRMLF